MVGHENQQANGHFFTKSVWGKLEFEKKNMNWSTLKKNHMPAQNVTKHSHAKVLCKDMKYFTLVKSNIIAQILTRHSHKGAFWEHMNVSRSVKSNMSAQNVTKHSLQGAVWEHTLVKSHICSKPHTCKNVIRHSQLSLKGDLKDLK